MTDDKNSFENLEVWKLSIQIAKDIYKLTLNKDFSKNFTLRDQIIRSAVSVSSNIAEGHERRGNKEYIRFLKIAKGSAGELRSQLYLAFEFNYINELALQELKMQIIIISKKLYGLIRYLENN